MSVDYEGHAIVGVMLNREDIVYTKKEEIKCGHEIAPRAKFCAVCGAKVGQMEVTEVWRIPANEDDTFGRWDIVSPDYEDHQTFLVGLAVGASDNGGNIHELESDEFSLLDLTSLRASLLEDLRAVGIEIDESDFGIWAALSCS